MLKWILYRWFSISIDKEKIDSDYFAHRLFAFVNSRGKWNKNYAYIKFVYCSDKYMEIYGSKQYAELANKLFKEIEVEEEKSRKRINEQMSRFLKEK